MNPDLSRRVRCFAAWTGVLVVAGALTARVAGQPRHLGQTPTHWLGQLIHGDDEAGQEAIRALGTRAWPAVLEAIERRDGPAVRRWQGLALRVPDSWQRLLPRTMPAEHWNTAGLRALSLVGPPPPDLQARVLGLLAHENLEVRRGILMRLPELLPDAAGEATSRARQILAGNLDPMDWQTGREVDAALCALGQYGTAASNAVPELLALLNATTPSQQRGDGNGWLRLRLVWTLGRMGPAAAAAANGLKPELRSGHGGVRLIAAHAFWRMTGQTGPLLDQCHYSLDEGTSLDIPAATLKALGPDAAPLIPKLVAKARPWSFQQMPVYGRVRLETRAGGRVFHWRPYEFYTRADHEPGEWETLAGAWPLLLPSPWEQLAAVGPLAVPFLAEMEEIASQAADWERAEAWSAIALVSGDPARAVTELSAVAENSKDSDPRLAAYASKLRELVVGRTSRPDAGP